MKDDSGPPRTIAFKHKCPYSNDTEGDVFYLHSIALEGGPTFDIQDLRHQPNNGRMLSREKEDKNQTMAIKKKTHPFHLVDPSPWPFVGSIGGLISAIGLVLLMHHHGIYVLLMGLVLVVITMIGWWRDVIRESEDKKNYTPPVQLGLQMGMALFITSEVMFFVAFFWAFFNASLFPTDVMGDVWPPKGIQPLNPFDLPYFNTLVLLLSGKPLRGPIMLL